MYTGMSDFQESRRKREHILRESKFFQKRKPKKDQRIFKGDYAVSFETELGPVQHLANIGLRMEQYDWLILFFDPLN